MKDSNRRLTRHARRIRTWLRSKFASEPQPQPGPGILRWPRLIALIAIAILIGAASLVSFAESYRGLFDWAGGHGLSGRWQAIWPLQVDVFIAVGELALFIALVDRWEPRSRTGAWIVTGLGLAVSVAGNVGHVTATSMTSRATAAVPPLAAAAALAVGLGVLKRVVAARSAAAAEEQPKRRPAVVADGKLSAARLALEATADATNPLSERQLVERFGVTRTQAKALHAEVIRPVVLPDPGHTLNGSGPHA